MYQKEYNEVFHGMYKMNSLFDSCHQKDLDVGKPVAFGPLALPWA